MECLKKKITINNQKSINHILIKTKFNHFIVTDFDVCAQFLKYDYPKSLINKAPCEFNPKCMACIVFTYTSIEIQNS